MRFLFFLLFFSILIHADQTSLQTMQNEKRVAYIIGNGEYDDSPLKDAIEHAQKMQVFLQKHGFEVTYKENASKREIIKGLRQFNASMEPSGIALFYYFGHMIQTKGKNYLIPIEAAIENDYHVLYEAIELNAILEKMKKAENRLNILIIDSAFSSPFRNKFRTKQQGLAKIKEEDNLDIILSQKLNKTVQPYPFTSRLTEILSVRGTSNEEAVKSLQDRYRQSYYTLSKEPFYFNLPDKLMSKEDKLWEKTLKESSIEAYTRYLSIYPTGKYLEQAISDIAEINRKTDEVDNEETTLQEVTQER